MREKGFTLIEILMTILLIGIVAVASIGYFTQSSEDARYDQTLTRLLEIKKGLLGDEIASQDGERTSFGYVGDYGGMPSSLDDLVTQGAQPSFTTSSTYSIGSGWAGPYIKDSFGVNAHETDGWGNNFVTSFATSPVTLTSYGADGVAGGTGFNEDLVMTIPRSFFESTISGFVTNGGVPIAAPAEIELYQPDGAGAIETLSTTITTSAGGYFSIPGVTFGKRAITAYIPSKVAATSETTIGPKHIIINRASFVVPQGTLDIPACNFTDHIVYMSPTALLAGSTVTFNYNVQTATNISGITTSWGTAATITSITLNGTTYQCGGPTRTSPCSAVSGQKVTFTNAAGTPTPLSATVGNGVAASVVFSADPTTASPTLLTFDFNHTTGCSRVSFLL